MTQSSVTQSILRLILIGLIGAQDSYLRYYPPFIRQDYSHYNTEVECYTGNGDNYAGNQNYTNTGKPCIDWKQTKYSHKAKCVYCRNPNSGSDGPWCYTDRLGTRESCHALIPKCGPVYQFDEGGRVTVETYSRNPSNRSFLTLSFKPDFDSTLGKPGSFTVLVIPGQNNTSITLLYTYNGEGVGRVVLKWMHAADIEPTTLRSDMLQDRQFRVEIYREDKLLQMKVNSKYYFLNRPVPGIEFDFRGRMYIGHDPDTTDWFRGCLTNLEYNGDRPLDDMDEWMKSDIPPHVKVYGKVSRSDSCMYVAPSNFRQPGYSTATRVATQQYLCTVIMIVGILLKIS